MDFGLSVLIAMKATFLLLAFAYLRSLGFTLLSLPLLYASLVSMLLSIASHPLLNLPMLLGKNPDGTFPIWSLIMFSPYLYFVRGFSVLRRLWSGEAPYSEFVRVCMLEGGLTHLKNCLLVTLLLLIALVNCLGVWSFQDMHICAFQLGIRGLLSHVKLNLRSGGLVGKELRKYQSSFTVHMVMDEALR